jgi:hypothetical protein
MRAIRVERGTDAEHRTRATLLGLLDTFDLTQWTFTDELVIDEQAWPHSHPVLTLDARYDDPELLLAAFVHEQLHWFEETRPKQRDAFIGATVAHYPHVPTARPEGAGDEESTRLHLLVCHLEQRALQTLLGPVSAKRLVMRLSEHHYRWIYRTVLLDRSRLAELVVRHGLVPAGLSGTD